MGPSAALMCSTLPPSHFVQPPPPSTPSALPHPPAPQLPNQLQVDEAACGIFICLFSPSFSSSSSSSPSSSSSSSTQLPALPARVWEQLCWSESQTRLKRHKLLPDLCKAVGCPHPKRLPMSGATAGTMCTSVYSPDGIHTFIFASLTLYCTDDHLGHMKKRKHFKNKFDTERWNFVN